MVQQRECTPRSKLRYIHVFNLVVVPGYLKGYVRRFAQASHDHRGTPEVCNFHTSVTVTCRSIVVQKPGRVVTLVHKEDWDKFSGAVSNPEIGERNPTHTEIQDAFPGDDIVWGESAYLYHIVF